MKKIIYIIIAITVLSEKASAQENAYAVEGIPEQVKKNASVITRDENILFEVTDIDRAKYTVHQVLTVMNEKGEHALFFYEFTNKQVSLDDVEIKVYDDKGKQVNRYKQKDLNKQASGEGLIEDGMYHYLKITAPSYPVTVEINYQLNYSGTLSYPRYSILNSGQGIQQSTFTVKVPSDIGIRYKEQKIKLSPQVSSEGKFEIYKWAVKDMAPVVFEEGAANPYNLYPAIILAPNRFRIYNTSGDMSTWKSFGAWEQSLLNGLDAMPDDRKTFFAAMVKDARTDREKIALVYEYLQKNFRYVSIQLGIGGYKPFASAFTDSKKYGDCKGLSFYTYSVLKSLGIKSYVALINAGYNYEPVDPAFPCNTFNHMILCVPQGKDSIWLECTSNTTDFAVLGSFTENRNALLVTENGGALVATPKSHSFDNIQSGTTVISLNEDGSAKTSTIFTSSGLYREILYSMVTEKKDDQKEFIVNDMGFRQPDVFSIVKKDNAGDHGARIDLEIEKVPEFTAGSKMFLNPRIYKLWSNKMPNADNRKQDFYFGCPFEKSDTTIYKLPAGYKNDALPKTRDASCAYASYTTKYWYDASSNEVVSTAKLVLKQQKIPAEKYAEVKKFFDEVLTDDAQKIVIKKE